MCRRVSVILLVAALVRPLGVAPVARVAVAEAAPVRPGEGTTIRVTTTEDRIFPDGNCSLREAVRTANLDDFVDACELGSGHDTILVPAGTYVLVNRCDGPDDDYCGDLDILDDVTIVGDGAGSTIVDGGRIDRVVQVHDGRVVDIASLTISGGQVKSQSGGGILNSGFLTLKAVVLRDNVATGSLESGGGGLANVALESDATATLIGCQVSGNSAHGGGGILNQASRPFASKVRLVGSTVDGNAAKYLGGGILQQRSTGLHMGGSTLTVERSTISRNGVASESAGAGNGAGIAILAGGASLVNSTVSGNRAYGSGPHQLSGLGGGIYVASVDSRPSITLLNATVADNWASGGGPGITAVNLSESQTGLSVSFLNTIIAENGSQPATPANCLILDWGVGEVTFTSLGHNLEDADSCVFSHADDWIKTDPLLAPLGDNGGGTETHLLMVGSPAIDSGDDLSCPCIDQRGVPRPQGRSSDIGAVEVRSMRPD